MEVDAAAPDVPQSEPLSEAQVPNNAGGFVFKIDDMARLRRFIILGAEGNNYYVSRERMEVQNAECVLRLLASGQGEKVVEEVTRISHEGRAPRQTPGIFVLAMCARLGDAATRRAALAAVPAVCRTASTLFEWVQRCKELGPAASAARQAAGASTSAAAAAAVDPEAVLAWAAQAKAKSGAASRRRGAKALATGGDGKVDWGRAMRRTVSRWYLDRSPAAVAYQATKYSQRNGWSHADLLRLAHPDPEAHAAKRRKLAAAKKAAAEPAEAVAAPEAVEKKAEDVDSDAEWVVVPAAVAAGEDEEETEGAGGGAAASEQGALAAAAAAAAAEAAAAAAGGEADADALAAAAEALRVADMKAIFAFLTHGTLPGQQRPVRRRKAPAEATGGDAAEAAADAAATAVAAMKVTDDVSGEEAAPAASASAVEAPPGAEAEAAADAAVADTVDADTTASAAAAPPAADATSDPAVAGADADTAMALDPATGDTDAAMAIEPAADAAADPASVAAVAADAPTETAAVAADANAPTAAAVAADPPAADAPAAPLSPVMQYLYDAHRLRKLIRAPPPLVKEPKPERRKRGRRYVSDSDDDSASDKKEEQEEKPAPPPLDPAVVAAHAAAHAAAVESAVTLIRRHRFGHEHVGDTALLRAPEIWGTFLEVGMPLTALIRNLGRMTSLGVMKRPDCLDRVTARLCDAEALARARVHPMSLLEALCTYRTGAGARGVARWEAVPAVCEALETAFYAAFKNVQPTGRRYLVGVDVSGSMSCPCAGMTSVECRQAATAVLMCLARSEPWLKTLAFSHELVPFDVSADDRLEEVLKRSDALPFGGTDCALPILHALEKRLPVDVFVILTDNETWFGKTHPAAALRRYRQEMALPAAKLVVLAFSSSGFSIADPEDPGMLDIAGLDSAVPRLVADFVCDKL